MTTLEAEYLSVAEAAKLLKVDSSTIRRWIASGALPAYRVGHRFIRLKQSDLARMITPANGEEHVAANGSRQDSGVRGGIRYLTTVDEIQPPTAEERAQSLAALARATELRHKLERKYGKFDPPSWVLLNEARRERTEQLP